MADEQYQWLNRDTAERLLRGESLEAVDAAAREQAERLAKALGSLSVEAAGPEVELPGEEGALAAFRKAREAAAGERAETGVRTAPGARRSGSAARSSDAGLVRLGRPDRTARRPRWTRPLRLALTAVLAAGTLGGVAVAAVAGVLPMPFHHDDPGPTASVSSPATPGDPLGSPSPDATRGGTGGTASPDTSPDDAPSGDPDGADPAGKGADPAAGSPDAPWTGVAAVCRDLRDGRTVGPDRRRTLEGLAGGPNRVGKYCKAVLRAPADTPDEHGNGNGKAKGAGKGKGKAGKNTTVPGGPSTKKAQGDQNDQGTQNGDGQAGDNNGNGNGNGNGQGDQGDEDGQGDQGDDEDGFVRSDRDAPVNGHVEHADRGGHGHSGRSGHAGHSGHSDRPGHADGTGHTGRHGRTDRHGHGGGRDEARHAGRDAGRHARGARPGLPS
ncbi:hypothetical protein AB0F77_09850 [Streptomyces sp. NPDC026672]|uniref:hypothetical protein n=1 Tax=unclassified Streptomyces TaxID=2593676 RepID=UPI0033DE32F2